MKAEGEDRGGNVSFGELTGEPTLVEQIHELESKSRWYEALVCYEQALREFKVTANGPRLQREELLLHKGNIPLSMCKETSGQLILTLVNSLLRPSRLYSPYWELRDVDESGPR